MAKQQLRLSLIWWSMGLTGQGQGASALIASASHWILRVSVAAAIQPPSCSQGQNNLGTRCSFATAHWLIWVQPRPRDTELYEPGDGSGPDGLELVASDTKLELRDARVLCAVLRRPGVQDRVAALLLRLLRARNVTAWGCASVRQSRKCSNAIRIRRDAMRRAAPGRSSPASRCEHGVRC